MKSRMNLVLVTCLLITGIVAWIGVRNHQPPVVMAATANGVDTAVTPALTSFQIQPAAPAPVTLSSPGNVSVAPADPAPADIKYTAQPGDTISKLAVAFMGSDSAANEEAIVSSNPSLQQDHDRIISGKTYLLPTRVVATSTGSTAPTPVPQAAAKEPIAVEPPATQPSASDDAHELRYKARPGDSVSVLAGALLGSNNNENRDAIIGANPSLGDNPDRVIVGKTYRIPVQAGQALGAAPVAPAAPATPQTVEPDSDQVVLAGSARQLRYTAKAGDNVSTLAAALLGSDTKENRDAIVNSNPSLKSDPDRVIAGQTYWIPAPAAPVP